MDPSYELGGGRTRVTRFPRPRGDGPLDAVDVAQKAVSPPTRGWTPLIDRRLVERFPRPRGDGRDVASAEVSPPTRGWTRPCHVIGRAAIQRRGFPAHAGMDRPIYRAWRVPAHAGMDPKYLAHGFPRPRGDGPLSAYLEGFAHAGMDALHAVRRADGFPRPRGDGPRHRPQSIWPRSCRVSPPTRGWTLCRYDARTHRAAAVSPPTRGWTLRICGARRR